MSKQEKGNFEDTPPVGARAEKAVKETPKGTETVKDAEAFRDRAAKLANQVKGADVRDGDLRYNVAGVTIQDDNLIIKLKGRGTEDRDVPAATFFQGFRYENGDVIREDRNKRT